VDRQGAILPRDGSGREPYSVDDDGVSLTVRVVPKVSRTAFAGIVALPDGRPALSVRVAAPPVEGAANLALRVFLSKQLAVNKSDLTVTHGETSRLKVIRVHGDGQRIARRLEEIVAGLD